MASIVYNSYKLNMLEATFNIESVAGVKMMLLDDTSTTPDNPDHDFVSDIVASEFSGTNYTGAFGGAGRVALANRAATADLTNDRAEFDFDDVTWTSLGGGGTPPSVVFAVIVREITSDAASNLISAHDIADTVTNGTNFTLQVGSEGALHVT
jgi:hypothetical protein